MKFANFTFTKEVTPPWYGEKSCLGKEGHHQWSQLKRRSVYIRKELITPLQQCSRTLCRIVSPWPSWLTLPTIKQAQFYPSQLFVSHVNGSPNFVRKCMKRWLGQRSSGRRALTRPQSSFTISPCSRRVRCANTTADEVSDPSTWDKFSPL